MPVTDGVKTVEDRLWAILLADTGDGGFASRVKLGNRVNNAEPGNRQRAPAKATARRPADLVEVEIDRGRSRRIPYTNTPTFGTFGAGPCPRIETRSQDFVITILSDDQGSHLAGELQAIVEDLIVGAGPQLGLPSIVRIVEELAGSHEVTARGKAAGVKRRVVTLTVRVGMRKAV